MLQLTFSEEEITELDYQRYHYPHPRVQRKMEALLLKAKGLPHYQIANCVGVCENTLRDYLRQYRDEGIEGLKRLEFYQPSSELEKHRESLEAYFKPSGQKERLRGFCPAVLKGGEIGNALMAKTEALELLALC
jgi:hypothetical protein